MFKFIFNTRTENTFNWTEVVRKRRLHLFHTFCRRFALIEWICLVIFTLILVGWNCVSSWYVSQYAVLKRSHCIRTHAFAFCRSNQLSHRLRDFSLSLYFSFAKSELFYKKKTIIYYRLSFALRYLRFSICIVCPHYFVKKNLSGFLFCFALFCYSIDFYSFICFLDWWKSVKGNKEEKKDPIKIDLACCCRITKSISLICMCMCVFWIFGLSVSIDFSIPWDLVSVTTCSIDTFHFEIKTAKF